jgi:hypothetical protein
MTGNCPSFVCLMTDAYCAVRALNGVHASATTPAALREGRRAYVLLTDYRKNSAMTLAESALVETALELIWARLRAAKVRERGSLSAQHRRRPGTGQFKIEQFQRPR